MKRAGLTFAEGNLMRESFLRFPNWTQRFWTWLTGRSRPGETAAIPLNYRSYLAVSLVWFFAGLAFSTLAMTRHLWVLLPFGWLITVGATRVLVSTIVHQCIHNRFAPNDAVTRVIAEAITVLTLTKSAKIYWTEHAQLHHRRGVFTTERDPSAQFLLECGFAKGLRISESWRVLIVNCISPIFHLRFFFGRIGGNLLGDVTPFRRMSFVGSWGALVLIVCQFMSPSSITLWFLGAYAIPVIVLYQISVLLEFVSEHAWLAAASINDSSWGRFCGSRVPSPTGRWMFDTLQWLKWSAGVAGHLVIRISVLPGDLPQHDFHHRFPGTTEWTRASYARTTDAVDGAFDDSTEFWGLRSSLHHVFEILEQSEKDEVKSHELSA